MNCKLKYLVLFVLLMLFNMSLLVSAKTKYESLINEEVQLKESFSEGRNTYELTLSSDSDIKINTDILEVGDFPFSSVQIEIYDSTPRMKSVLNLTNELNEGHLYVPSGKYFLVVTTTGSDHYDYNGADTTPVKINLKVSKSGITKIPFKPEITKVECNKNSIEANYTYYTTHQSDDIFSMDSRDFVCQLADNKSMKNPKKIERWNYGVAFDNLKSNKTYYLRVRTRVKLSSGKFIYSPWSKVKKVKTKK